MVFLLNQDPSKKNRVDIDRNDVKLQKTKQEINSEDRSFGKLTL
jgi:hypothetical protein